MTENTHLNVLMISTDRGLLGQAQLGDVVERHQEYAKNVARLDIIVQSKGFYREYKLADNATVYATNSKSKLLYINDTKMLAKKLFSKRCYDLIVAQDPLFTGLAAIQIKEKHKNINLKLLIHFHGDYLTSNIPHTIEDIIASFSKHRVIIPADAIRVMSQGQKNNLIKLGVKEGKIRVISTPIELKKFSKFNKSEVNLIKQENNHKKIVLFVGRGDKVKDLPTTINAMSLVLKKRGDVRLNIIGNWEKWTEHLRFKSYPWLSWAFYPQEEVIDNYHACDLLVSSSRSESFGKVLVEAGASGKPVVATATTGAKEIIQDGYNGFLVPIGNAEKLAEKILYLLNNPRIAKDMGENGERLAKERFGDNTEKIIQFWQEIVRG